MMASKQAGHDETGSPPPQNPEVCAQAKNKVGCHPTNDNEDIGKRLEVLIRENERMKKRLLHVENLGRIVVDCKQTNLILAKENGELHETVEQLLRMSDQRQYTQFVEEDKNSDTTDAVGAGGNIEELMEVVEPTSLFPSAHSRTATTHNTQEQAFPSTTSHEVSDRNEIDGSGCFQIAQNSNMSEEITGNLEAKQNYSLKLNVEPSAAVPKPMVPCSKQPAHSSLPLSKEFHSIFQAAAQSGDGSPTNAEISHGENVVVTTHSAPLSRGHELDDLFVSMGDELQNSGSVTVEFEKLVEIFTGLAQRVMQARAKARNTQAFCDAVLRDNDKLKRSFASQRERVSELEKVAENKKLEMEQLSMNNEMEEGCTHRMRCNSVEETTDETPVAERMDKSTGDNILSRVTDPVDPVLQIFIGKLQNRVGKLERQRAEILHVNKQWHSQYNKLKEECNTKIVRSKAEMQKIKQQISGKQAENENRKLDTDLLLRNAKEEVEVLQGQKGDLGRNYALEHNRAKKLSEKVERFKSENRCLNSENRRLNQALEAAYSISKSRRHPGVDLYDKQASSSAEQTRARTEGEDQRITLQVEDLNTQIAVLQEQVKIYREDFETERRDREKSQSEKQRLSEEMTRMEDEMRALNQQVRVHEHDFRQERREKQGLQRQLSKIHVRAASVGTDRFYYDVDRQDGLPADDHFQRGRRRYPSPKRDRLRYGTDCTEIDDVVIQTGGAGLGQTSRRYTERMRTNVLSPITQETRYRRKTAAATSARRIGDGYHERPRPHQRNMDLVYLPNNDESNTSDT